MHAARMYTRCVAQWLLPNRRALTFNWSIPFTMRVRGMGRFVFGSCGACVCWCMLKCHANNRPPATLRRQHMIFTRNLHGAAGQKVCAAHHEIEADKRNDL